MKTLCKRSAFTLTEMLLLLATLSILAAMLFPAFTRARRNAGRTNCQSNLRQIGAAWLQYAHDSDGTLMRFSTEAPCELCVAPTAATAAPTTQTHYWWGDQKGDKYDAAQSSLRPYLAPGKSYSCPAFARVKGGELGLASYGYNAGTLSPTRYGPAPDFAPTPRPVKLSSLGDPARTVAFADAAQLNAKAQLRPSTYLSKPSDDYPNFHARHEDAGNVLFCDGHVAPMRPIYRTGQVGYLKTPAKTLRARHLGDIDENGDLTTNELFNGTGKP